MSRDFEQKRLRGFTGTYLGEDDFIRVYQSKIDIIFTYVRSPIWACCITVFTCLVDT